jgi:transposase
MLDPRDENIRRLERLVAELRREIEQLREENGRLRARIEELEESGRANSQNSSKPPSSEPIGHRRHPKPRSPRRPGGQPGHEEAHRELLPSDRVDRVLDVRPKQCSCCGKRLEGDDPEPWRHQVADLPSIRPKITEYRMHSLKCSCGATTPAPLPEGVSLSPFGPQLTVLTSVLTSVYGLSKRQVQELLSDAFGLDISTGAIVAAEQRMSEALEKPVEEAREYVADQPVVHVDETGWREHGQRVTAWTGVTAAITVFLITAHRCLKGAGALLRTFGGVLVCDRFSVYRSWPQRWKQYCWAHLKRTFKKFLERGGRSGRVGRRLLKQVETLFDVVHRARDGTIKPTTFRRKVAKIRRRVEALLRHGSVCGHPKTQRTCLNLLAEFEALWTFSQHEGVDPTNNAAERALRPLVIWRKSSFGTWSAEGSTFLERLMTVRSSLRQQGRNVLLFLQAAYTAWLEKKPAPSLLPLSTP